MKALMRGFGLALLAVVLLGAGGCGADNDSTATQLQGAQGGVPKPDNTGGKEAEVAPQASSYAEYTKQQKALNSDPSKTEYGQHAGGRKK